MKRVTPPISRRYSFSNVLFSLFFLLYFGVFPAICSNGDSRDGGQNGAIQVKYSALTHTITPIVENDDSVFGDGVDFIEISRSELSLVLLAFALAPEKLIRSVQSLTIIELAPKQSPPRSSVLV